MRLLSFDTTSPTLQLCLMDSGEVIALEVVEPREPNRQEAATKLIPGIDHLLGQAGWRKQDLQALVVGQGPGSFTGIRCGIVTARALAMALGLPLLAVSALDCYASLVVKPAGIILYCGLESFYAAAYRKSSPGIVQPGVYTAVQLLELLPLVDKWFADKKVLDQLRTKGIAASNQFSLNTLPEIKNLAVTAAQIAWDRLSLTVRRQGANVLSEQFPWANVVPLYLKGPSVTIKR